MEGIVVCNVYLGKEKLGFGEVREVMVDIIGWSIVCRSWVKGFRYF